MGHVLASPSLRSAVHIEMPKETPSALTECAKNIPWRAGFWNFDGDGSDLWIGCHYNHSTVMLYQRLAPNTKSCRVTYAPGGVVTTIDCK